MINKAFITLLVLMIVNPFLYGQFLKKFRINDVGLLYNYTGKKIDGGSLGSLIGQSINETNFARNINGYANIKVHSRISLKFIAGLEHHQITPSSSWFSNEKMDFTIYRLGLGPQIRIFGNDKSLLQLHLDLIFFNEGYLKRENNNVKEVLLGPNGIFWKQMVYYEANNARRSIDMRTMIRLNLSPSIALNFGGGYNLGLNKSANWIYYTGPPYDLVIDDTKYYFLFQGEAKENYMQFSAGLTFYLKQRNSNNLFSAIKALTAK